AIWGVSRFARLGGSRGRDGHTARARPGHWARPARPAGRRAPMLRTRALRLRRCPHPRRRVPGADRRRSSVNKLLNELTSLWSFSLRELRMWQTYRTNQLMWVVDIFVNAFLFFLVGQLIGGSAASLLGVYGTNYVSFILIGLAVNYVITTNLADPFHRVTRTYWYGTMDLYLLSPMSVFTPFLGLMGRSFTDDYPRIFVVAAVGELFFGARFDLSDWVPALVASLLIFVAAFGIGTISASMFYLI